MAVGRLCCLMMVTSAMAIGFANPTTRSTRSRGGIDELMEERREARTQKQLDAILSDCRKGRWSHVLEREGITVWKRDSDPGDETASFSVKAACRCEVPASVLTEILNTNDAEVVKQFNPTIEGQHDVVCNRLERITYILTKPIFPLRARDFIIRTQHVKRGTTDMIVNSPTTHARTPSLVRSVVRGRLGGIHVIEATGADACWYTMVHQIDPAGAAPRKIVNWFALRKPVAYMEQLRALALMKAARAREELAMSRLDRWAAAWADAGQDALAVMTA